MSSEDLDRWVDLTLERTLGARDLAPDGFTDRVMARVGSESFEMTVVAPALPWWVRVTLQPVTVLSLALAGGLAWGWQGLWALATASRSVVSQGVPWLSTASGISAAGMLALELALATLLALSAGPLARAAGRFARRIPLTSP